jgi:formylglycine-generating enzyme
MSAFDPYRKWLGIAPADQPPNHYRLLGLDLFESDPDVIDAATEQRVVFLRTCATGEHIAESQKLLNEVAAARLCLLNADKKQRYDEQLRANVADPASVRADKSSSHESLLPRPAEHDPAEAATHRFAKVTRANLVTFMAKHRRELVIAGVVLLVMAGWWFKPTSNGDRSTEDGSDSAAVKTIPAKSLTGQSIGAEWSANGLKMPFRWCPPGTFVMGSPKGGKIHYEDEDPVSVSLSRGFWIGKYEVTQAEWREAMGSSPWDGKENVAEGNRYPAVMISWSDATLFCRTLTEQERRAGRLPKDWEYRLPTEAQWEYACRAGTETQYSFGNEDDQLVEHAWFMTNSPSLKPVHEVGRKTPNAWGLFDLHGNVTEWCQDGYFSKLSGGNDPEMVLPSNDRVRRGGSVLSQTTACRSAFRGRDIPTRRWFDLGFRVAIGQLRATE